MPNLNAAIVTDLPVPILPLDRQRFAADVLSALDDLIENNQRRSKLLEQLAQTVYREWFVRFRFPGHEHARFVESPVGPIPDVWELRVSGDLARAGLIEIGDGYRAKNSEFLTNGEGLTFVRVANVRDGYLSLASADHLPLSYLDRLKGKQSRAGDTVISMKGTVGRTALVAHDDPPLAYSPQVSYWRSLDHSLLPPSFIYLWIRSEDFRTQSAAVKGATDMADYVNLTDQRRMRVPLPPRPMLDAFEAVAAPLLLTCSRLRRLTERLVTLRDLLLPKLVTGQIEVPHLDQDVLGSVA
jgi:type I restriction enzyme S subunit